MDNTDRIEKLRELASALSDAAAEVYEGLTGPDADEGNEDTLNEIQGDVSNVLSRIDALVP